MLKAGVKPMSQADKAAAAAVLNVKAGGGLDKPAGDAAQFRGFTTHDTKRAAKDANARQFADAARRALRAEDTTTTAHRLQTGRMDRRAIARASMGALDVMTRRMTSEGIRTAVVVMVDMSSSMGDACAVGAATMSRMEAVAGAASVIVPAIERAGAEVAVYGFTSSTNHPAGVLDLKAWQRRLPTAEAALDSGALGGIVANGGTPMVAPILFAERQISQRRVTRRVVVWLCDGEPSDHERLAVQQRFARRSNIEHVGIGLDVSLAGLFPAGRSVMVKDLGQLAKAFEALLIPKPGQRA